MSPSSAGSFAYVVFSDDWGRHPSSCQHIIRRILGKAEVMWVNTVGLRTPRLSMYDVKRAFGILRKWTGSQKSPPGDPETARPRVVAPPMLPYFQWGWARSLNHALIMRKLEAELASFAPGKRRVLVSTLPIIPGVFASPLFARKVYYCVDDFTTWPGVSGKTMLDLESELLPRCDLLIATSTGLLEDRGRSVKTSHLLTHGVDKAHFSRARTRGPVPPLLEGIGSPIIGMFGAFDARTDAAILKDLSARFPSASIVVLGPVDRDLGEFSACANIHFPGPVPYRDLPDHIAAFDVLILPYLLDASTVNINPLKLKEYLATGKPVISTRLPEAVKLGEYLLLADRDGFSDAVSRALSGAFAPPAGLDEFLDRESWESKADQFFAWALEGM